MSKGAGFETGLTVRPLQSPVYPVSWNRRLRPSHPTKVPTNMERSRAITQTGIHTDFRRFSKVMILVSWWGFERVRTGPQPSALCMIVHRARWCLPSSIGQQTPDNRRWQGHTKPLIIPNLDRHLLNSEPLLITAVVSAVPLYQCRIQLIMWVNCRRFHVCFL